MYNDKTSAAIGNQEAISFANGLFPIHRYFNPASVVYQWQFSQHFGGAQEVAAVPSDDGCHVEISYVSSFYGPEDPDIFLRLGTAFHRLYMQFLIDAAKRRMEKLLQAAQTHVNHE